MYGSVHFGVHFQVHYKFTVVEFYALCSACVCTTNVFYVVSISDSLVNNSLIRLCGLDLMQHMQSAWWHQGEIGKAILSFGMTCS